MKTTTEIQKALRGEVISTKFARLLETQKLKVERRENVLDLDSRTLVTKWVVWSGPKAIKAFKSEQAATKFINALNGTSA